MPEGTIVVEILDGYGIEVAIERFVNEIHDDNKNSGPDGLPADQESGRRSLRRNNSTRKFRGNFGVSKHDRNLCRPFHLYSKEGIPILKKNHTYE